MKLTAANDSQASALHKAFMDRVPFTLEGAGLKTQFIAGTFERSPNPLGGSWDVALELEQVSVTASIEPAAWNGPEDGLPPVGLECEYGSDSGGGWQKIKVLAHTRVGGTAAVGQAGDMGQICMGVAQYWRPIRTAEQLAAEERERQIQYIISDILGGHDRTKRQRAELIYDAGYRKTQP